MPKIVDHEKKKQQIVQFAWQSIVNEGAKGATVRNIANLAKMTPGQIRYYYPNHSKLLEMVFLEVIRKVKQRIQDIYSNEALSTVDKVIQGLLAVIPLDKERYADMEVWMAFHYELHQVGKEFMRDEIKSLIELSITYLEKHELLDNSLNQNLSVIKAHALLDGLALHKLLNSEMIANEDIIQLVVNEVNSWLKE
ncbi:TetR/AcrR family transcriptional regulator [Staphylococcus xylosus]|uniref:TetR/AcrR family transcriptional regulator n=1 Tax=Staphylococcus xylosus TaxID=1288 RepID=UPI000499FA17|nr:TetR/AcrR family transcriptional regulator [Staphylococcus xylosus]AID41676.1 HTH-type transcriptional regulator pksA [Staphylococcus xylosus]RIM83950.1 TetR/AcrR family transcriptional regulator [Staphylococcus xylosus]